LKRGSSSLLVSSKSCPDRHAQAEALDARLDHCRSSDQDRPRQAFVHHRLHRAQHGFFLALGVDHALQVGARALEHRLHQQASAEHELAEPFGVLAQVGDRTRRHARLHRRLRHRRRQRYQQARVERARDEVVRAEARHLAGIGAAQVRGFLARQFGNRAHAGQLHRFVDRGGAHVERAAEDVGEAERVVDLVGIVGAARRDDAVRAHLGASSGRISG
jgi:hypothetical protein